MNYGPGLETIEEIEDKLGSMVTKFQTLQTIRNRFVETKTIESSVARLLILEKCVSNNDRHNLVEFLTEEDKDLLCQDGNSYVMKYASLTEKQSLLCAKKIGYHFAGMKSIYPSSQMVLSQYYDGYYFLRNSKVISREVLEYMLTAPQYRVYTFLKFFIKYSWHKVLWLAPSELSHLIASRIDGENAAKAVANNEKYMKDYLNDEVKLKVSIELPDVFFIYFPHPSREYLLQVAHKLSMKDILEHVPSDQIDEEVMLVFVSIYGDRLGQIPEPLRTDSVCKKAVSVSPRALKYVPMNKRSLEMCKAAYKENEGCLPSIPPKYRKHMVKPFGGL